MAGPGRIPVPAGARGTPSQRLARSHGSYDWVMGGCGRARTSAATAVAGCVMLMTAGCATGRPSGPVPPRPAAAHASPAAGSGRQALAASYLAIAVAGNRRLDIDFGWLDGRDRSDLAAARADLRDAAATERLFDQRLAGIAFPAGTEMIARLLVLSNQARAQLTTAAAGSLSLPQLQAYRRQLTAANGPVEEAVSVIRSQLGLPPADTS
jgi:hypothetical protein